MNLSRVAKRFRYIPKLFTDQNLTQKASLNALVSILDYAANIIVGFLVTPLMVSGLGSYDYGAWQILQRLVGYISPASRRPTQVLKFDLAKEQKSADYGGERSFVSSTLAVFGLFLPVMVVLGSVLAWFVPAWIKTPVAFVWNVRIACALLVLNLITTTLREIPYSILEGENKGYKRMGISTFLILLSGAFTWAALYWKTGIIGVAGATLLSSIIASVVFLQVARTHARWFGVGKTSKKSIREFLGLSWWFLGWNLIMNLMLASDVVVLGLLNSVESVTNYSLSKYAPETAITAVAIIVFGVLPGLGGIIGSGDLARAARVRGEIMSLTWLIVSVLGVSVLLWNRTFISLWVGPQHFIGPLPNLLIVLVVLQFVLIRTDANVIDLTLRLNRKVTLGAISVAISLAAAGYFVYFLKMGIIGVCVGIMLGRLILTIAYPGIVGQVLKIRPSAQIRAILRPALATTLLFVIAFYVGNILPTQSWHALHGWFLFLPSGGVTVLIALGLAFISGLSTKQQQQILRRFRSVLNIATSENKI